MKFIPVLKCRNMKEALRFYTTVLDFEIKYPGTTAEESLITLKKGDAELQLCSMEGSQHIIVNVETDEVDELFKKFLSRGLDTSAKKESPVHRGPLDQTWGRREFYITDTDGNTLRYGKQL